MRSIWQFLIDEDGPTAVEYAVLLAMILMVVISGIATFGNSQNAYWGKINGDLDAHGFK